MIVHSAGAVMIATDGSLLLQRRDNIPNISSPNMLGIFGGHVEENESYLEAAIREIEEETGYRATPDEMQFLIEFENKYPMSNTMKGIFYLLENIDQSKLKITEGVLEVISIEDIPNHFHEIVPTTCFALSVYLNRQTKSNS